MVNAIFNELHQLNGLVLATIFSIDGMENNSSNIEKLIALKAQMVVIKKSVKEIETNISSLSCEN